MIAAAFDGPGIPPKPSAPGGQHTGRNLLFGLLALQNNFIDRDALLAAFTSWVADKSRPLGQILVSQRALDGSRQTLLDALVDEHLRLHGGDAERSLAALAIGDSTRNRLKSVGDSGLEASLSHAGVFRARSAQRCGNDLHGGHRRRRRSPISRVASARAGRSGRGVCGGLPQPSSNREVALKQILDRHADDSRNRARFLMEAEITGRLEHPGIVPVYGLGTYQDGRPYYAMRFIRGDSLKDAIAAFHADEDLKSNAGSRSLELRKLLRRFLDVCNAIDYAHSRGVLHRDVKPGNVIVGRYGETLVVDWGLAKPMGHREPRSPSDERTLQPSAASGSAQTLPGAALGTPAYMSPEQAAGEIDQLGPRSDVYSLGATLYCLLTGRPPFVGADLDEMLRRVTRAAFPPPRQIDPTIDRALEKICLRAMALNPKNRYETARTLADDVERWIADEPVTAMPENWRLRLARWSRRNRAWVRVAAAALVVGLMMTGAFAMQQARSAERERRAHDREGQARAVAETRLTQIEKANDLLAAVFEDIDPRGGEKGQTLLEILGDRLEQAADQIDGAKIADPLTVAKLQITLGKSLLNLGRFAKALELFERSRQTRTALLGREDEAALDAAGHLAHAYFALGRFTEAAALSEETLKLQSARLGPTHEDTLQSRENLAVFYSRLGRLDEAIPMQEESLKLQTSKRGPEHPYVFTSRNNLAHLYAEAGRLAEAIAMQEETLKRQTARRGADHSETLNSRSNLAMWYARAGRLAEAIAMDEETLRLRASKLGADHPETLVSRNNLALAYGNAGRNAEAAALHEENVKRYESKLGPDHRDTLNSRGNLAIAYEALGRWAAAEQLRRDNVTRCRKTEKPDSLIVARELFGLGTNLMKQSRWAEAEPILRECLAIREKAIPDGWLRFNTMSQLGGTMLSQAKFAEAEPLLVQGYEGMKSREKTIPPTSRPRVAEAAARVVRLYEAWRKTQKLAEWKAKLGLAEMPDDVFAPKTGR